MSEKNRGTQGQVYIIRTSKPNTHIIQILLCWIKFANTEHMEENTCPKTAQHVIIPP